MGAHKIGEGVHQSYKEEAQKGFDVLFRVKIKGRSMLTDSIPLHMSLKIFKDRKEFDIANIEKFAKEHDVVSPDPKKLTFKAIIFTSERTGDDFYMLEVNGLGPQYKALYDEYDGVGNVYKRFFTHITIDKTLYEDIKENGLKPHEIEFSHLILEAGAGNTIKDFEKSENLEKGIKHAVAGLAVAGAMAGSPAHAPKQVQAQSHPAHATSAYSSDKMLRTIASVESQSGHNTSHAAAGGMHHGEHAYGKYALMPETIRGTIGIHRDLKTKHAKAMTLRGDDMRRYMEDNPGLEDTIAQRHLQRLEHHFGQNPQMIGYAWLNGVSGAYRAKREKKDINNHWHVLKVTNAYAKQK